MALVRCETHGLPEGRKFTYTRSVQPVVWPETAAICGLTGCDNPGLIWLTGAESRAFDKGLRVFSFNNASMKVKTE